VHNEPAYRRKYASGQRTVLPIPNGTCEISTTYEQGSSVRALHLAFDVDSKEGRIRHRATHTLRGIDYRDLLTEFAAVGFELQEVFRSWSGQEFQPEQSERIVAVFRKVSEPS
jgi:hypothetical protein